MTGEISSMIQSLQPPNRDLPQQETSRVAKGQEVAATDPVNGKRRPDEVAKAETRAEETERPYEEALNGTVSDLNILAQQMRRELRFSLDDESGEMVVKVIDKETDKVLRQIPSDEILALRKRMADVAGVIFSDSV